jgi:signal transduction histidine kinase
MTILPSHIPLKDALTKESEQQGRALRVPEANIENEELLMSILIVTGIEGARNCAAVVGAQLGMEVEVADGRKAALTALRRSEFAAVVVDETMAECDPSAAEAIWDRAGLAIPLQVNFALSGAARLTREIRAALHRREREQGLARRAAAAAIESELKTTVAGLLLHSQLALSGSESSSPIADRLRIMADLAGNLRQQLNSPLQSRGDTAA